MIGAISTLPKRWSFRLASFRPKFKQLLPVSLYLFFGSLCLALLWLGLMKTGMLYLILAVKE